MSARDELTKFIDDELVTSHDRQWLIDFRDKWHPELPDGAIELAPGTHLAQRSVRTERTTDSDVWEIIRADGSVWVGDYDYSWREHGQPIPEPTPEITVGCIVRSNDGDVRREVRAIDGDEAWTHTGRGRRITYRLDHLTYVAASWDEVPA